MSMIKTTRTALGMPQGTFGQWLADRVGRSEPYPKSRISEYENLRKTPHRKVRDACCYIAAQEAAREIRSINLDSDEGMSTVAKLIVDCQKV